MTTATLARVVGENGAESIVDLPLNPVQLYLEKQRLITVYPLQDEDTEEELSAPNMNDNRRTTIKRSPKDVFGAK